MQHTVQYVFKKSDPIFIQELYSQITKSTYVLHAISSFVTL